MAEVHACILNSLLFYLLHSTIPDQLIILFCNLSYVLARRTAYDSLFQSSINQSLTFILT